MAVDTPARIAVIGAGPIGLESALYARYLGYDIAIYDRGEVADSVQRWGHVRMFSRFSMNRSNLGLAMLLAQDPDHSVPGDEELLTGQEWYERYLQPLSKCDLLVDEIREHTEVVSVGRESLLKTELPGSATRGDERFRLLLRDGNGVERVEQADVVVDASGTFAQPNWLGQGGIPAVGELACRERIDYGLPDILGSDRERFSGRTTLVVGSGHSAATNVIALAKLASEVPETHVTWITRRSDPDDDGPLTLIDNDRLAERHELSVAANRLAKSSGPQIRHLSGVTVSAISHDEASNCFTVQFSGKYWSRNECEISTGRQGASPRFLTPNEEPVASAFPLTSSSNDPEAVDTAKFDNVVANVGGRPDTSIYRELQVHQCYATEGPMKLAAALLGESSADCLDQKAHGPQTLVNPEPNFYIIGAKSFGRGSNFLFSIGLEQIREVFTIIGGREDLDLYSSVTNLLP